LREPAWGLLVLANRAGGVPSRAPLKKAEQEHVQRRRGRSSLNALGLFNVQM